MRIADVFFTLLAIVSLDLTAAASDQVISLPAGWIFNGEPISVGTDGIAVVIYRLKIPPDPTQPYDSSRVLQVVGNEQFHNDFPSVARIEYSATGQHLLAVHVDYEEVSGTSLLTNQGQVLWTKSDSRAFSFSTTGEVVYAWTPGGNHVEVFSVTGNSLHIFDIEAPLIGAVVLGSGQQAVLMAGHSLICLDALSSSSIWQIDLPFQYPEIWQAWVLDPSRFILKLLGGAFVVVRTNGLVEYTYDPMALGAADPVKESTDYARYGLSSGPSAGTLTLFDRSSVTHTLDLASGQLTPKTIDTTPPQGFELSPYLLWQQIFFFSRNQIVVRQIPDP